jgi:hypothetical protein
MTSDEKELVKEAYLLLENAQDADGNCLQILDFYNDNVSEAMDILLTLMNR